MDSDLGGLKAQMTRSEDRARKAFGYRRSNVKRRYVAWATTNNKNYLRDISGERRWWPCGVTKKYAEDKNRNAFKAVRDQLFAEAVVLEPNEKLWLDTAELKAAHKTITETRRVEDPLEDQLRNLKKGKAIDGKYRVSNIDVQKHLGYLDGQGKVLRPVTTGEWNRIKTRCDTSAGSRRTRRFTSKVKGRCAGSRG